MLRILRRLHKLPCNYTEQMHEYGHDFSKLMLGQRSAACRQKPSVLRNALMFQRLAIRKQVKDVLNVRMKWPVDEEFRKKRAHLGGTIFVKDGLEGGEVSADLEVEVAED